jgi:hypothetical protein
MPNTDLAREREKARIATQLHWERQGITCPKRPETEAETNTNALLCLNVAVVSSRGETELAQDVYCRDVQEESVELGVLATELNSCCP